jgi:hypothetical protein
MVVIHQGFHKNVVNASRFALWESKAMINRLQLKLLAVVSQALAQISKDSVII